MNYADIPSKRIEAHSRVCATVVAQILGKTLLNGDAADRTLAAVLKQNHQFGARDRRIISETLFSVLRWWGWLRYLAPDIFQEKLSQAEVSIMKDDKAGQSEEEEVHLPAEAWYPCFAAAWLMEGRAELPPSASWWLYKSNIRTQDIPVLPADSDILSRRKCLRPFFDGEMPALTLESLLPNWASSLIQCPEELGKLIIWQQRRPPIWLRAQSNDLDRITGEFAHEDVKLIQHERMKYALKTAFAGVNIRQTDSFRAGKIEIQDIASQAVALIAAPKTGEQWWDCCAGAGGKTLHLAWLMNGKGHILASDNREYKLEELRTRAKRCGFSNIICHEWLGIEVKRYEKKFHGVLVDAPCSCSGTWRRNPGARWTTAPSDITELAALQRQLLGNAAKAVMAGGTLLYATCSMFAEENQAVVESFLKSTPDFELVPFESPLDGAKCNGMLQTWPWLADCDSMFIAKMRRRQDAAQN